jgi:hypothetical protein
VGKLAVSLSLLLGLGSCGAAATSQPQIHHQRVTITICSGPVYEVEANNQLHRVKGSRGSCSTAPRSVHTPIHVMP